MLRTGASSRGFDSPGELVLRFHSGQALSLELANLISLLSERRSHTSTQTPPVMTKLMTAVIFRAIACD